MKDINQIIKIIAESCIGLEEIRGNLGFKQEHFNIRMKSVGHLKGQAWCAYFTELVWKESYQQYDATRFSQLDKLFHASAVKTWKNFKAAPEFSTSNTPEVGSLIAFQSYRNGKRHWTGHIGVVVSVVGDVLTCIEGNSNDNGSREGYKVAKKTRLLDFSIPDKGLRLLGFIHPII